MSERKRRRWTGQEKLRIVLTCMQPGVEVSEVCRREGINLAMYYLWKRRRLASAARIFDEQPTKRDARQERQEREMARMKDVIAEITAENLELRNALGLEDHAKMPPELQQRVEQEVELPGGAAAGRPAGR